MPREGDYQPNQIIPGTVYQVITMLGAGGMGTVYEVEDTSVGKRYVLKTLHAALRDRKELAMRITKEARTLAKLSHANIVEVVTAGATSDDLRLPYFVMQKLNGHTLRSILAAKGRLPLETAYGIAIDLLDALEHAHAHGVIHRDVKPENIFIHRNINGTYVTKLLDFGVMRLLSSEIGQTGHRFVGTLRYAPPEQLRGEKITPRTDLYSAALVLYEMIAGKGPFDDEPTDRDIAGAHIEREPPPLSSHVPVPLALDDLVASALAKDPASRPKDAFTFAAALRDLSRELSEIRRVNPSYARLETVQSVVAQVHAPASVTNLDDAASSAPSHFNDTEPAAEPARAATDEPAIAPSRPSVRRIVEVAIAIAVLATIAVSAGLILASRRAPALLEIDAGPRAPSAP
jgi:serine/threonine protein kinase